MNADDPFVHRFSGLQNEKIYIGLSANACWFQSHTMGESKYCPNCQTYSFLHFGQLGHYYCSCGFTRPEPNISAQKVFQTEKGIGLIVDGEDYQTTLKGMYNAYNALFANRV
ncbi:hypothetical protein [Neobacillus ginsengisoli]|uniref:UDP-N-acetylmuramyl tripeptide synthase n=1 Tax=Neobacillus ginsengisoli TaxID=904295 RepID=A0ABT9Y1J3_9BACI|nr:hypothetical protein [Neobacillus ginsengisoli]MDQ0201685.1 UDP-N-acetylmuramyl tripeptide synthase [Neobacillus ginsengisoli]